YNGYGYGRIVRLNEDGSVDTSFLSGTGFNAFVTDIALQADGKILVSGSFVSYNGNACSRIVRLNSDGTLDNTFNVDNVLFNGSIDEIKLQPDGRILLIGNFNGRLTRLNPDGSVDPTFSCGTGPGPAVSTVVTELELQSDGKILICGNFTNYNGTSVNRVVRLNSDGTIDNSFNIGTGANGSNLILFNLTVQTDGKIFLTGDFSSFNGVDAPKIVRLNSDGSVDNSFQIIVNADYTYNSVQIQPDGKLIIGFDWAANAGYYRSMDRFNADGTIDPSFNQCTGFNGPVYSSALQSDGKIIVGGYFTSYNGAIANRIVRINEDGTIDYTFNSGLGANNGIREIVIQSDGKILIGGSFTTYNGIAANMIVRLNPDGTLDNTFSSGADAGTSVYAIAIQPDGKILVGGMFGWYANFMNSNLVRLNIDGTIDYSFNHSITDYVFDILVQSDDQIIVAGNGILKRLNTDGSTDFSFATGSGPNSSISTCALQSDGKLIIGGAFTSFNGVTCNRITRLNTDGSIDNTFNSGSGANGYVLAIAIQADGKILIGGSFNQYGLGTATKFACINSDGSCDFDFPQLASDGGWVNTFQIQSDGKSIVGGDFKGWNSMGRNRITRINLCAPTNTTVYQTSCNSFSWLDNQILSSSGTYVDTVLSILGCDSIITLDLTIVPSLPLSVNSFSQPSDANSCVGTLGISTTGSPDFTETIDGGSPITHSGYTLVENLCPGVHSLFTTNGCGDTLTSTFVIPVDSNYIFNNPFIDSIAVDSLGATIEDCDIYYNGIDTA
ncbi:MAG: hypothetical protein HYZ43_04540, partial [Flavobacteriia bacterium]|nr:hypothetical protein [Flavobacteriia bacterium]